MASRKPKGPKPPAKRKASPRASTKGLAAKSRSPQPKPKAKAAAAAAKAGFTPKKAAATRKRSEAAKKAAAARKRSEAAKKAAATRKQRQREAERARAEQRRRRSEAARKGWATRRKHQREAEAYERAEREAIAAEAFPRFETFVEVPVLGRRTPRQIENFRISLLRLREEELRAEREALEAHRERELTPLDRIRRELAETRSEYELHQRIIELAEVSDYEQHELFSLFYSPEVA